MGNNVFFSVGIPVYNAERYLGETIESILLQSFSDFELVLVNDGSTDGSAEICEAYAQKDSRVRVIHQANGGISAASNCLMDACVGNYIFLMDNDDKMCEEALKNAYDVILNNNYPDFVQTHYYWYSDKIVDRRYPYPGDHYFTGKKDERAAKLYLDGKISVCLWNKFIRNDFLKVHQIRFVDDFRGVQDTDVTFKLYRKADTIVFGDFYSIKWLHPREGSVSSSWKYKSFEPLVVFYRRYADDVANWDMSDELKKKMKDRFCSICRGYTLGIYNMSYDELIKSFRLVRDSFNKDFNRISKTESRREPIQTRIIFAAYRVIGMVNTAKLMYFYLHRIKKI